MSLHERTHRLTHLCQALTAIVVAMPLGCLSPQEPASPAPSGISKPDKFYPIGICYYFQPMLPQSPADLEEKMAEDFRRFQDWGFNCVVLRQAPDEQLPMLIKKAADRRLRVIPSARCLYHFVRFAELPAGATSADRLVQRYLQLLGQDDSVVMHFLPDGTTPDAKKRTELIEQLLGQLDPKHPVCRLRKVRLTAFPDAPSPAGASKPDTPPVASRPTATQSTQWLTRSVDELHRQAEESPQGRRVLLLPTSGRWTPANITPEWWSYLYHECLAAGWTDGLIFQRYRSLPTGTGGLVDQHRTVTTRVAAMLKQFTAEIAEWGPMLAGMQLVARSPADETRDILSAYFSNGRRRLLLLYNRRFNSFANQEVQILPDLETQPITRAIDLRNGERHFRRGTVFRIPLRLRPAQARLYELF